MHLTLDFWRLVLDYLRVATSWPVAALAITLIVIHKFKTPITALINRIATIKLPGGSELLLTPQSEQNATDKAFRQVEASPPSVEAVAGEQKSAEIDGALKSEKERSALWEYRYLNFFLVPASQSVLDWLANRAAVSYSTYDSWMLQSIPNPKERGAILQALAAHHLIRIDDTMISVTDKGREYLQWRGPLNIVIAAWMASRLPPVPAPAPPDSESTVSKNFGGIMTDPSH